MFKLKSDLSSYRKDIAGNHSIESFYHDVVHLQVIYSKLHSLLMYARDFKCVHVPFLVTISCIRDLSVTYNTTCSLVKQSEWEVSSTIVNLDSIFPEPFGVYVKNNIAFNTFPLPNIFQV